MKRFFIIICFLTGPFSFVFAGTIIEAEGRYWFPDLSARAKVTADSVEGTDINFVDDLGIQDEDFPDIWLTWSINKEHKIRLGYTQVKYNNDNNISRAITFNGQTYAAGAQVDSDFNVEYLRLAWIYEFINIIDDTLVVGAMFDIKGVITEASLDAPALGISESENFTGGLPTLGLTFSMQPFKMIELFAEASGMSAGDYGYLYDAEAGVKIVPFENFTLIGGYRIFELKLEDNSDYAKLRIMGPYAGVTIRF